MLGPRPLRRELSLPALERPAPRGLSARTDLRCRGALPRRGAIGFDRSRSRLRLSGSIGGEKSGIHDRDFLSKNAWSIWKSARRIDPFRVGDIAQQRIRRNGSSIRDSIRGPGEPGQVPGADAPIERDARAVSGSKSSPPPGPAPPAPRAHADEECGAHRKVRDHGTRRFPADLGDESPRGPGSGAAADLICHAAEGATGSGGAEGVPDEWNFDIKLRHLTHLPLVT